MSGLERVWHAYGMRMAGADRWRWQYVSGSYLFSILLAATVSLTGAGPADAREPQYVLYEVLADHPACSGPGHIAYDVELDVKLDNAGIIRSEGPPEACLVRTRRGNEVIEVPVPCPEESQQTLPEDIAWMNFCPLTEELRPMTIRLQGSLTGCITMAGHRFVDGAWTATTERPDGTRVARGGHDDPRLQARYSSAILGTSIFGQPNIEVWLRLEDEVLPALPGATVEVAGAAVNLSPLLLVDGSRSECVEDPASCLIPPPKSPWRVVSNEIWSVCSSDPEVFPNYGIERVAPRTGDE